MQKKQGKNIEDTYSPSASFRVLKIFLAGAVRKKIRIHQCDVVGAFLQRKVIIRVFVNLPKLYAKIFPNYMQKSSQNIKHVVAGQ
jgi:hypothetical protein